MYSRLFVPSLPPPPLQDFEFLDYRGGWMRAAGTVQPRKAVRSVQVGVYVTAGNPTAVLVDDIAVAVPESGEGEVCVVCVRD